MSETPISLYFGVEKGERASLEAIAKASVEWAAAVRDLAAFFDPELEIRLEFVETKEGSVWLQNLIKAVREGDEEALKALALGIILFFAIGPFLHLQADFGEAVLRVFGHEHTSGISEQDKQDIANRVIAAMEQTSLPERRRNIIREVEKDPRITSIGVDLTPRAQGPRVRINREQFPSFGASPEPPAPPPQQRDTKIDLGIDVVIARASLREGDQRPRWRFTQGATEWSADIEDQEFVWALHNNRTGLPLAIGQHMRVDVAIDLLFGDGVWTEENRRILRVIEPHIDRRQGDLLTA